MSDHNKNRDGENIYPIYEFYATWYLTWFQHETFDNGQTDDEALLSFERFVGRKQMLNEKSQMESGKDVYCLMGAEDRWRWCGAEPDGSYESHSKPPCRCKYCKDQGVIRIGH